MVAIFLIVPSSSRYPKTWTLRSWRQEVEDSFNAATWIRRFLLESLRVCIVPWSVWEHPRLCAVVSRPASLQMLHFILRSMRVCGALYSNNNAASFLLWLLTTNSDALLVWSAFGNIQCSNFLSWWVLSVRPFGGRRHFFPTRISSFE